MDIKKFNLPDAYIWKEMWEIMNPEEEAPEDQLRYIRDEVHDVVQAYVFNPEDKEHLEFVDFCRKKTKSVNKALDKCFKEANLPLRTVRGRSWKRISIVFCPPFVSSNLEEEKKSNRCKARQNQIIVFVHLNPDLSIHTLRMNKKNSDSELWQLYTHGFIDALPNNGELIKNENWEEYLKDGIENLKAHLRAHMNSNPKRIGELEDSWQKWNTGDTPEPPLFSLNKYLQNFFKDNPKAIKKIKLELDLLTAISRSIGYPNDILTRYEIMSEIIHVKSQVKRKNKDPLVVSLIK